MLEERKIKSISFLYGEERVSLVASYDGKFKIPTRNLSHKKEHKYFSAREAVEHEVLRNLDPFLTLSSGEKVRVYLGGDPTYKPVFVESILDYNEPAKRTIDDFDATQSLFDYYGSSD